MKISANQIWKVTIAGLSLFAFTILSAMVRNAAHVLQALPIRSTKVTRFTPRLTLQGGVITEGDSNCEKTKENVIKPPHMERV